MVSSHQPLGVRLVMYAAAVVAVVIAAFLAGAEHFRATHCSDPEFDGKCDVSIIEGFLWGGVAAVTGLVVAISIEVAVWRRSRHVRSGPG